jgi:hypothetical protein
MPRLVVPHDATVGRLAANDMAQAKADNYKDRLVKYIPAESVALYTFTDKLLNGYYGINEAGVATAHPSDWLLTVLSWALFVLALVGTPIYLYRQRLPGQPWGLHATISTVAFFLWAYTLGAHSL